MSREQSYNDTAATPMLRQYLEIKERHRDAILLYRLGDFYEMFFDDAKIASCILDITLTSRNRNDPNPIPLCGVPYHSVEPYIAKLLEHGKKVAICEQVEDPKTAKGVVRRAVTRMYTPGVVPEGAALDAGRNNFLAAVELFDDAAALAIVDISTGLFRAAEFRDARALKDELVRIEPREIIARKSDAEMIRALVEPVLTAVAITERDDVQWGGRLPADLAGVDRLAEIAPRAHGAAAAAYAYLSYTQCTEPVRITEIEVYRVSDSMHIDEWTKRNLELIKTVHTGDARGSLWWAVNRTRTSMGARLLKQWLDYPLVSIERICARQNAVASLVADVATREHIQSVLATIPDLERLTTRMAMGTGNARDAVAIGRGLKGAAALRSYLLPHEAAWREIVDDIAALPDLAELIARRIVDDPPHGNREGGMIREGVNPELDELCLIRREGKQALARMEAGERSATGISSLKIRYNKVFGYYIEVTHTHRERVPERYIRKQTLSNAERYITEELKTYEDKVLSADDRIRTLEHELFDELQREIARRAGDIARTARALAQCDSLASFAQAAVEQRYCRPTIVDEPVLEIEDGRHPVLERLDARERFVPNDVMLGGEHAPFMMITGPNMAGKSTVMRQTALIVLMAQMGMFVPASRARIGIVDRMFTRIGASDALAKGQSTFMVEMTEAAAILKQATPHSLVIIDEIGRGTSTFDGLAIAWAVAEDLCDRVRARTMFATHYHELTELAATRSAIKNHQIAVKEWNDRIIFLRRLVPGAASMSYGIHVARLAGLDEALLVRARELLANLESGEFDDIGRPRIAHTRQHTRPSHGSQMALFTAQPLVDELRAVDLTATTPLEALNLLHRLKQSL